MEIPKQVPYIWEKEKECLREDTREAEHWYMQQGLTGAEAMRVCQLYMKRLRRHYPADHYMLYLIDSMSGGDYCLYYDFALAIEEMMDERDGETNTLMSPGWIGNVNWEDCTCCDKCQWGPQRKEIKPWIGSTGTHAPHKLEEKPQ